MKERVCLVTGATSGIGRETTLALARDGAAVVLTARDPARGERAQAEIQRTSGNSAVDLLLADFASLDQVRQLAAAFLSRYDRLDVLVNSAGLYLSRRLESENGFEMTLAVNHLAPFLLTNLLQNALKAAAPSRVITVTSNAHRIATIRWSDLQGKRLWYSWGAYAQSKLANLLLTVELARRMGHAGVTANCVHPGFVATNFAQSGGPAGLFFRLARPFLRSAAEAAADLHYLAVSAEVEHLTGQYFVGRIPSRPGRAARNPAAARRLWQVSAEMVGLAR